MKYAYKARREYQFACWINQPNQAFPSLISWSQPLRFACGNSSSLQLTSENTLCLYSFQSGEAHVNLSPPHRHQPLPHYSQEKNLKASLAEYPAHPPFPAFSPPLDMLMFLASVCSVHGHLSPWDVSLGHSELCINHRSPHFKLIILNILSKYG